VEFWDEEFLMAIVDLLGKFLKSSEITKEMWLTTYGRFCA
jgi:hypothetical protein